MKKTTTLKNMLLLTMVLFVQISFAQWNPNTTINTPVIRANSNQIDLRMLKDGKGGAFIAWKDYRVGLPDIYIQYLDSMGNRMWDTSGVPICTNPADQSTPAIVSDMSGGAIVGFSDWRSGIERDVYAQRVDSTGTIQWTLDGVGVATKTVREHNEKLVSDGAGGAIVIFEQQVGAQWDIWAQRISHAGVIMWTPGGIPVCTVNANRQNPKIQSDGKGGVYVAWQDLRNLTDYNVYAQRISGSGVLLWGTNAIEICNAPGAQTDVKMDPDSTYGGVYIAWIDKRNGIDYDIYAQKIDSTGTILWANDGVPVCTAIGNQSASDIVANPAINGFIATWKDDRAGNYDIYAQKIDHNGNQVWAANGVPICTSAYDQLNPNILDDHADGAIIVWQDSSFVDWNVKSQRINGSGVVQWTANGENVCNAIGDQTSPKNCVDGKGGAIYAWQDYRTPNLSDIYAHHLYSDGTPNMGIKENVLNAEITTFPNPFTDNFTITINLLTNEKFNKNSCFSIVA